MTLLACDIAALMAAPRLLLLDTGVPAPDVPLPLWRASPRGADWVLHAEGSAPGEAVPLRAAPGGLLGVLAAAPPAWLALWPAEPPPVLPEAAPLLAAALADSEARNASLRAQLLALRAEHEDARTAMAGWLRSAGQAPPGAPRLVHDEPAVPAPPLAPGTHRWARSLPASADAATALALHLPAAACGPGTMLRVRLLGAESERVAGAWIVPGPALAPGWLTLDLPLPAPPWGETARVEIAAHVATGDTLAISPALRLLASPGGPRFVLSPFHDPSAEGLRLAPAGVRLGLPDAVWGEAPRVAALQPGGSAELMLPAVPLGGFDALHVTLAIAGSTSLQAALWCGRNGTAWRDAAPDGTLDITLPVGVAASAPVRLLLRAPGTLGARVEWRGLSVSRAAI